MQRKPIAAALIIAALSLGLAACGSDEQAPTEPSSAAPTTATESVFGPDPTDVLSKLHRDNATAIVEAVEQRGGTADQAVAALLAAEAETGWRSGLSMAPPSTDIRDIYGWRFSYNVAADSNAAVTAATDTFMDSAAAVPTGAADPVVYALAVQREDPRGYDESEHFYKSGETAQGEYAAALTTAQAAYTELRPAN